MSQGDSQSNEFGTLSERTDNVDTETAAVIKALAKAKRVTRCILVGVLLILVVVGFLFYYQIYQKVTSQEAINEMGELAQAQLEANMPTYSSELNSLVESAKPKLQEAFQAQLQKDMPKYQAALDEQRQLMIENLQTRLKEKLTGQQDELLEKYKGILQEEFPQIADEERHARMISNVKVAMDQLVQKYYVDEFREHLERVYDLWEAWPVADPVAEGGDPLADQAFGYLLELLQVKLAGETGTFEDEVE
jgi:hypothetical protein